MRVVASNRENVQQEKDEIRYRDGCQVNSWWVAGQDSPLKPDTGSQSVPDDTYHVPDWTDGSI